MKKFLLSLGLVAFCSMVRANDSAIEGTGGTPSVLGSMKTARTLQGEHRSIRMVREKVALTVYTEDYDVVADFTFTNEGKACSVLMGFPEGAAGDINFAPLRSKTAFKNFRTTVDGRVVRAKRIVADDNSDEFEFSAYWVKSVRFARHQTRHIRVSYRSPLGSSTNFGYINYDFTGGNWKGKVEESLLTVAFTAPGQYHTNIVNVDKGTATWRKGATSYWRWRNWEAQTGFSWHFARLPLGSLIETDSPGALDAQWTMFAGEPLFIPARKPEDNYSGTFAFAPAGLVKDGCAFISLRSVMERMRDMAAEKARVTGKNQRYGELKWDAKSGLVTLVQGGAKKRRFMFRVGTKTMFTDVNSRVMPQRPFFCGRGDSAAFYVPLDAFVKAWGGQYQANTRTGRVWYSLPLEFD